MNTAKIIDFLSSKNKTSQEIDKFKKELNIFDNGKTSLFKMLMDNNNQLFVDCLAYLDFKSKNKDGFNIVGCLVLESNGNMLEKVFNYIKKENIPYSEWGGGLVESPKTIGYKMPSLLVALMNGHPTFSSRIIMEIPDVFDLYDCREFLEEMKRGYDIHEFCWLGKNIKINVAHEDDCKNNLCKFLFIMASDGFESVLDLNGRIKDDWFDGVIATLEKKAIFADINSNLLSKNKMGCKL